MLIGINGALGAGKDTVGAYLCQHYGFSRIGFADLLKKSAASLFGIDFEDWNEWKNDEDVVVYIQRGDDTPFSMLTARRFLQRYGTESHREVFGYDFWIDQALAPYDDHTLDNVVVTDARFENEIDAIKKRGGYMMKVVRPGTGGHSHVSEKSLPDDLFDFVVSNTGSFNDLFDRLDEVMQDPSGLGLQLSRSDQ